MIDLKIFFFEILQIQSHPLANKACFSKALPMKLTKFFCERLKLLYSCLQEKQKILLAIISFNYCERVSTDI